MEDWSANRLGEALRNKEKREARRYVEAARCKTIFAAEDTVQAICRRCGRGR